MDVVTAFFNVVIKQDIFMEQPEGLISKEYYNNACKLLKYI